MGSHKTGTAEKPKRGRWSTAERARLREFYGLRDNATLARELKRSVASVVRVAQTLFPEGERRTGPWTASEVLELKRYLGATSPQVIARVLGRTVAAVEEQIIDLGRIQCDAPWTREETALLKRLYGTRADEDLSLIFGRSTEEIRSFAREHLLSKDKAFVRRLRGELSTRMPPWREEEVAFLRESYATQSNLGIARRLRRSVKSVVSKAHYLGLKKSSERLREMGRENVQARYASN